MQKVKITLTGALVVQFLAETVIEGLRDPETGAIYVPMNSSLSIEGAKEVSPVAETRAEAPAATSKPASTKAAPTKPAATGKTYTEDELMEMDVKELEKLCVKMDIDPSSTPGKNTNKKLRLLILEKQEGGEEPEEEEVPEGEEIDRTKVLKVFKELSDVDIDANKAITRLTNLGVNPETAKKVVKKFTSDSEMTEDDAADLVIPESDEPEEKPTRKGPGSGKAKSQPKEELIEDFADLEEEDKVKVWWESQQDYFTGVVSKVNKKGVYVTYDADGEEEILDEEDNTEVFRLS
jgi:hypothetical protein